MPSLRAKKPAAITRIMVFIIIIFIISVWALWIYDKKKRKKEAIKSVLSAALLKLFLRRKVEGPIVSCSFVLLLLWVLIIYP